MIDFIFQNLLLVCVSAVTFVMFCGTVYNFFLAPRLEKMPNPTSFPKVSLLIPARNEAKNMDTLLPLLSAIEYPQLEILILNDHSEDETAQMIREYGGKVRLIEGRELPLDWLGKNWACEQLAENAKGEILIFCDADVKMAQRSVAATVGMMQMQRLDALTCLPKQIMETWAEKAVLPVLLFLPLLGFVPLNQIPKISMPALSVGCGQWFAFTRRAYEILGRHESVKDVIVEDMALGRRVKEKGLILGAVISSNFVATRMYTSFSTVWMGFSKNLAYLTGTGYIRPPLILVATLLLYLSPLFFVLGGKLIWLLPLSLLLMVRLLSVQIFNEPKFGWLWSPLGAVIIPLMGIRSWWGYRQKNVEWKGRVLTAAFATNTEGVK